MARSRPAPWRSATRPCRWPLPDIHLTDVGKDENGATHGEVARQAMDAVVDSAKSAVGSIALKAWLKDAGEMADEAADQLKILFE